MHGKKQLVGLQINDMANMCGSLIWKPCMLSKISQWVATIKNRRCIIGVSIVVLSRQLVRTLCGATEIMLLLCFHSFEFVNFSRLIFSFRAIVKSFSKIHKRKISMLENLFLYLSAPEIWECQKYGINLIVSSNFSVEFETTTLIGNSYFFFSQKELFIAISIVGSAASTFINKNYMQIQWSARQR